MSPQDVARCGLNALGRKLDAVPGERTKIMAFMMSRLMSRGMAGSMFKMMMGAPTRPEHQRPCTPTPAGLFHDRIKC